eukprot:4986562-Pyramimonas_sp.AAC.1
MVDAGVAGGGTTLASVGSYLHRHMGCQGMWVRRWRADGVLLTLAASLSASRSAARSRLRASPPEAPLRPGRLPRGRLLDEEVLACAVISREASSTQEGKQSTPALGRFEGCSPLTHHATPKDK